MSLASDIKAKIDRDFHDKETWQIVTQLLSGLDVPEKNRVSRCVLFVANGNFEEFQNILSLAKTDYRDAIMAGEYEYPTDRRLRDLSEPFKI